MSKLQIVFWTMSGNTQIMADFIAEGARQAGAEVQLSRVGEVTAEAALAADVLVLGCPAMGAEELEQDEFAPFFEELLPKLGGKKLALFGSYGWGGGEWMRTWESRCSGDGANIVCESVICNDAPDDDALSACRELGMSLV